VESRNLDILSTWADQFAKSVQVHGVLVSGQDAYEIFSEAVGDLTVASLRSLTDDDITRLVVAAREHLASPGITEADMAVAVERTRSHWPDTD
jgi:hypothetical protein